MNIFSVWLDVIAPWLQLFVTQAGTPPLYYFIQVLNELINLTNQLSIWLPRCWRLIIPLKSSWPF